MRISNGAPSTNLAEDLEKLGLIETASVESTGEQLEEGTSGYKSSAVPVKKGEYERWRKEYESKKGKKDGKEMDESDDLDDEEFYAEEDEEFYDDADLEEGDLEEDVITEEQFASAQSVVETFMALTDEEVESLEEADIATVEEAMEVLDLVEAILAEEEEEKREIKSRVRMADGTQRAKTPEERRAQSSSKQKRKARKAWQGSARSKRVRSKRMARRLTGRYHVRDGDKRKDSMGVRREASMAKHESFDAGLADICEELKRLSQSLASDIDTGDFNVIDEMSRLVVTGFEDACDSAFELACMINDDLQESDYGDDDTRLSAGKFFDTIAQDASAILEAIDNGDVDMEDAVDDLLDIALDLERGVEEIRNVN